MWNHREGPPISAIVVANAIHCSTASKKVSADLAAPNEGKATILAAATVPGPLQHQKDMAIKTPSTAMKDGWGKEAPFWERCGLGPSGGYQRSWCRCWLPGS